MTDTVGRFMPPPLRRFAAYPEYSHSGIEWLGEIPAHWEVKPLKRLATLNDEALSESTDSSFEIAYVDISSVDTVAGITDKENLDFEKAPSRARRIVRHGDVIVSTVRTYLRAIAAIKAPEPNLVVSTGFAVVRPRHLASSFAAYALRAPYFVESVVANSVGVSYPAINASRLACFPIPYPDLDEQRVIADFLDRETAKIDALVTKKERLIELLQEKRTALITRAVTRGLNPNVPMKDSGVEWLGEIPAHWDVVRSKALFIQRKENALPDDQQLTASQQYGVIPQSKFAELEGRQVVQVITGADILKHVEPNDFVISMRSFQGGLEHSKYRGSISSAYVAVCPSNRADVGYFSHLFKSTAYVQAIQSTSDLVRDGQALRFANFAQVPLPLAPSQEQKEITSYLDERIDRLDRLVGETGTAIRLLKEYRTALISAAVTGKIDVREAASP